jgi:hypothetical protein
MAGKSQRDWTALRNAYITGEVSLSEFARQHNLPLRSVQHHAAKSQWQMEKERYRIGLAEKWRNHAMTEAIGARMPSLMEIDLEYILDNKEACARLRRCCDRLDALSKFDLVAQQRANRIRSELYHSARLAAGADAMTPQTVDNRIDRMSDEEILEELTRLRKQMPDDELEAELRRVREANLTS